MIEFKQLWLKKAKEHGIKNADMYQVNSLSTGNHFWIDGVCGRCVASGETIDNAIDNAIVAIKNAESFTGVRAFMPCFL